MRYRRVKFALFAIAMIYPWLISAALLTTWVAAASTLGREPRPYADDPKFIGTIVSFCYDGTCAVTMGLPVAAALGATISCWFFFGDGRRTSLGVLAPALIVLSWLAGLLALWCIGQSPVGAWFMD